MKETTLLKIALVCSLVGLIVLYFISSKIEFRDYRPVQISQDIGDDVKLKGTVTGITDAGNVVFIELNQESQVTIVLFTKEDDLKLSKGDEIEVFGEVQEYKSKNEIIAQKIRVIE